MKFYYDETDKRNLIVAEKLRQNGEEVYVFSTLKDLKKGDFLIFSPAKKFDMSFLENLPNGIVLVCGNLSESQKDVLKSKQVKHLNLMKDETFTIKNANLTAEGVLALILEKSPRSIFEENVLLLGGGRVGIACANLLNKVGIKFAFVTWNSEKMPSYYLYTPTVYLGNEYLNHVENYSVIVNSIPAKIIQDEDLAKISPKTLFLETASIECLEKEKVNHFTYLNAPALPSKYAVETAGEYVFDNMMRNKSHLTKNLEEEKEWKLT